MVLSNEQVWGYLFLLQSHLIPCWHESTNNRQLHVLCCPSLQQLKGEFAYYWCCSWACASNNHIMIAGVTVYEIVAIPAAKMKKIIKINAVENGSLDKDEDDSTEGS